MNCKEKRHIAKIVKPCKTLILGNQGQLQGITRKGVCQMVE